MTHNTSLLNPGERKLRLVCPHCGSADLVEDALGRRRFDVTSYTDGSWEDRRDGEWETETWSNECNACGELLQYDQLVEESSSN